jgi:outer membrane receptor protein involved in Fe transport
MINAKLFRAALLGGTCAIAWIGAANAVSFNIPAGDLKSALNTFSKQTGVPLIVSGDAITGTHTSGVKGELSDEEALTRLLNDTGFVVHRHPSGAIAVVRGQSAREEVQALQIAQAAPSPRAVETVTVTSSKLGGADVQSIPIAITALSQEQLTSTQTAGGPDLVKQVPNLTFTKTNFTGYSIQIRGIGTQAISVTTDPAVAVAFNDIPFIRNHFFEQEFFDVSQVEVLRGPQGTLYGRNATAGVVNLVSAKPTDHWEALASADVGNYNNRRLEGMLNIPIVGDRLGLRVAGEWTKRDGYSFNETTGKPIDGRDLWSGRVTLGFKPIERLQVYAVWEHFDEKDDRVRSAKQLCKKDPGPSSVDGVAIDGLPAAGFYHAWLSQGCKPTSLYSPEAFETPNGQALPFVAADEFLFNALNSISGTNNGYIVKQVDPYSSKTQSRDLRVIESDLSPTYSSKNDTFELNADFELTPALTLSSQTGYNKDQLRSTEDFNRFNTVSGFFEDTEGSNQLGNYRPPVAPDGIYCDPQLGCSDKMVGEDLSQERAWQFSQELRLASHFSGPFNFSVGGNYMHYQTTEDYYVFFNLLTATVQLMNRSGPGDFAHCYTGDPASPNTTAFVIAPQPSILDLGGIVGAAPSNFSCSDNSALFPGTYIDPNPISNLDGNGHNYFRSVNPYRLNSFAGFGEAYYQLTPDIKLTAGLRWTDDSKRFWDIPSWAFLNGGGYPVQGIVNQEWKEWTGRFNVNWTPKFSFTDQTMFYASYARGYKGGGANPPPPQADFFSPISFVAHPLTFAPEFVNSFELGTKNEAFGGALTLNADVFYYDYKGYQISQIVDRTSINLNFDATVKGAELEATWEPVPGLRFNFAGGLQDSSVDSGQSAIDLMDRTAGHTDWMVVKPWVASTSNCILPTSIVKGIIESNPDIAFSAFQNPLTEACDQAYGPFLGAIGGNNLPGFDASTAPNNGEGFAKDLSGNKLPNTPPFTLSIGGQYSMPISEDWAGTLRGDFYWQGNSFARIFNDKPYDQLHGYTNVNLALIFTNQDGWQAMLYAKNVFDTTAITGAFLNSDDTALTTNVFLTDPRLFGIRITKNW